MSLDEVNPLQIPVKKEDEQISVDLYQENSSAGSDVKLDFGVKNDENQTNILSFGDASNTKMSQKNEKVEKRHPRMLGDKKLAKLGT